MADILKSFLVTIGYKVDTAEYKKAREQVEALNQGLKDFAATAFETGAIVMAKVKGMADDLAHLHWVSQRTGSSIKDLKALAMAAEEVGLSGDQMVSTIDALSTSLQGIAGQGRKMTMEGFGVQVTDDTVETFRSMAKVLHDMAGQGPQQYELARTLAEQWGVTSEQFRQITTNFPGFMQAIDRANDKLKGVDFDKAGDDAAQYKAQIAELRGQWDSLMTLFEDRVVPFLRDDVNPTLSTINDLLKKADSATLGWSTAVLALGSALGGLTLGKMVLGQIGAALGLPGAAAGGAAAAGGLGVLGTLGLGGLGIAAAGVTGIQLEKWASTTRFGKWEKETEDARLNRLGLLGASDFLNDIFGKIGLDTRGRVSGDQAVAMEPAADDATAKWIGKFEAAAGPMLKVYDDMGKQAIGFGHQLTASEHFTNITTDQAYALLNSDTRKAQQRVLEMVHVGLNANQLKALTSLAFNMGGHLTEHSQIIKDINMGASLGQVQSDFMLYDKAFNYHTGQYDQLSDLRARRRQEAEVYGSGSPVTLTQTTTINVNGAGDPREAARLTLDAQGRVNGDMLRNAKPKVH